MKKSVKVLSLVLILLMILSLAGCGASASKSAAYDMAPAEAPAASMERAEAEDMMLGSGLANTTAGSGEGVQPGNINTEKIIYSAEACVETTEYETTIEDIYALVEELGGEVVKILFLLELKGLNGREVLKNYSVASVVAYDGK